MPSHTMRRIGYREVFPVGLGGMPISIDGRPDHADAIELIGRFIELGGNFIDTANVYCLDDEDLGHNERLIRDALPAVAEREAVMVATKGGMRRPGGRWITDAHPDWLRASCERSLRDLGVDRIDLYQLHAVDPKVKLDESIGELLRLVEEGKIAAIGVSNVGLDSLKRAASFAPIVSVQNRCSIFCKRDFHNGVIDYCAAAAINYIAHSPLGGYRSYTRTGENEIINRIANEHVTSPYQVALAWLLGEAPQLIVIPGARRMISVEDSHAAGYLTLKDSERAVLAQIPDSAI